MGLGEGASDSAETALPPPGGRKVIRGHGSAVALAIFRSLAIALYEKDRARRKTSARSCRAGTKRQTFGKAHALLKGCVGRDAQESRTTENPRPEARARRRGRPTEGCLGTSPLLHGLTTLPHHRGAIPFLNPDESALESWRGSPTSSLPRNAPRRDTVATAKMAG